MFAAPMMDAFANDSVHVDAMLPLLIDDEDKGGTHSQTRGLRRTHEMTLTDG